MRHEHPAKLAWNLNYPQQAIDVRRDRAGARCASQFNNALTVLGQACCFIIEPIALAFFMRERGRIRGGGIVMELRAESPRKFAPSRLLNRCAQCGQALFLPEWSEYLDQRHVRHLWVCDSCGYRFETLVSFPEA
jgi:hypothetical protein